MGIFAQQSVKRTTVHNPALKIYLPSQQGLIQPAALVTGRRAPLVVALASANHDKGIPDESLSRSDRTRR